MSGVRSLFGTPQQAGIAGTNASAWGLQISTSLYGVPIPIVYGRNRVPANVIWTADFAARSSGGGGGGSGGSNGSATQSYSASFIYAVCEGPVTDWCGLWQNRTYNGEAFQTVGNTPPIFITANGLSGASPWSYLTTNHPSQALSYPNLATLSASNMQLGSSVTPPSFNFDVVGLFPYSAGFAANSVQAGTYDPTIHYGVGEVVSYSDGVGNSGYYISIISNNLNNLPTNTSAWSKQSYIYDANPRDILVDLLTNSVHGCGFPSALLGDWTQYSDYCVASNLFLSPVYATQQSMLTIASNLMEYTNSDCFFSDKQLKIVPLSDTNVTGNGVTYTANSVPIYDITDDDLIQKGTDDPVTVTRKSMTDSFNQVKASYVDMANNFNASEVMATDQAYATMYGPRPMPQLSFSDRAVTNVLTARTIAQTRLQRELYIRNTYEFSVGWKFVLLEPGDIVTLPAADAGIDQFPVRITSIEESGDGEFTIQAEDYPSGVHHVAQYPSQAGLGYSNAYNESPGSVVAPEFFQTPPYQSSTGVQVGVAVTGQNANWGGCNIWASYDNSSYQRVGQVTGGARYGTITSAVSSAAGATVNVALTGNGGQILSGTALDAQNLATLCMIGQEFCCWSTATLVAPNQYTLTLAERGQQNTLAISHAIGEQFIIMQPNVFISQALPQSQIGTPIYFKFTSFNLVEQNEEDISDVTQYSYTLIGNQPLPLTALTATGGMFEITIGWTFATGQLYRAYTEIWGNTTDDLGTAFQLTSVPDPNTTWVHPGLQPGQEWFYWGRVVDTTGNKSAFFPTGTNSGIAAAPSADPSALLTQLNNAISFPQLATDLATPISLLGSNPIQIQSSPIQIAVASIQESLDTFSTIQRVQYQEALTNQTMYLDPSTGKVALLATATVTTDVQAQIDTIQQTVNADAATLATTVTQLTSTANDLTTAQSQIAQLSNQINLTATQTYVDNAVGGAASGLASAAGQEGAIAASALQSALDEFTQGQTVQNLGVNLALAQSSIQSTATALQAEAVARSALVAQVAANAAGILSESTTRANADSALASEITTLTATVNSNTAAISTESTTRANADSALASEITSIQSAIKDANGNLISSATLQNQITTNATAISSTATNVSALQSAMEDASGALISSASVQTTANTALSNANQALASWTVKVDTNSAGKQYVGGLELVSGGSSGTQFAISADQLVLYMPDGTIPAGQTGPVPVMEVAAVNGVNTLGFNGALIVDGSISARSINSNNLTIRDGAGNIILGAGTPLSLGNISGLGAFASLGQISPSNASTYIASGAIGSAEIGNAAVGTLSIDGNAVTVPEWHGLSFDLTSSPYLQASPNWTQLIQYTTSIQGLGSTEQIKLLINASVFVFHAYNGAVDLNVAISVNNTIVSQGTFETAQAYGNVSINTAGIVGNGTATIQVLMQAPGGALSCTGMVQVFSVAAKR